MAERATRRKASSKNAARATMTVDRPAGAVVSLPVTAALPTASDEDAIAFIKGAVTKAAEKSDLNANVLAIIEKVLSEAGKSAKISIEFNIFNNPGEVVYSEGAYRKRGDIFGGDRSMKESTNISADRGAVVAYKSTLDRVRALYKSGPDQPAEVQDLQRAIEEFAAKLEQAKEAHADEAQVLSQRLEELAAQASKPPEQRKKGLLQLSASGLKEAVSAVGEIVPGLIAISERIAQAIAKW